MSLRIDSRGKFVHVTAKAGLRLTRQNYTARTGLDIRARPDVVESSIMSVTRVFLQYIRVSPCSSDTLAADLSVETGDDDACRRFRTEVRTTI